MPRDADFKQPLCADIDGFSLHAAVRCGADDRQALEQLCRYITRPALANERVQTNATGQVVLKLKTAWRDGTTHLVMSPLEFMQRPRQRQRNPADGRGAARLGARRSGAVSQPRQAGVAWPRGARSGCVSESSAGSVPGGVLGGKRAFEKPILKATMQAEQALGHGGG